MFSAFHIKIGLETKPITKRTLKRHVGASLIKLNIFQLPVTASISDCDTINRVNTANFSSLYDEPNRQFRPYFTTLLMGIRC